MEAIVKQNHEQTSHVYRTSKYDWFKISSKNRPVDKTHVNKLIKAIQKNNLLESRPITVSDDLTVIDGQHRLAAAKKLNIPIYYQITNLGIQDAPAINCSQKNWDSKDYMHSFSEMGNDNYTRVIEISKETHFSPNAIIKIISNMVGCGRSYKVFRDGKFEIDAESVYQFKKILLLIRSIIERIKTHPKYHNNYKYVSSTRGMDSLFSFLRNELDEKHHELFARKMYDFADKVYRCATIKDYHDMYMRIYKYHNSHVKLKVQET